LGRSRRRRRAGTATPIPFRGTSCRARGWSILFPLLAVIVLLVIVPVIVVVLVILVVIEVVVVLGLIVGTIVIALFMPLIAIIQGMQGQNGG